MTPSLLPLDLMTPRGVLPPRGAWVEAPGWVCSLWRRGSAAGSLPVAELLALAVEGVS